MGRTTVARLGGLDNRQGWSNTRRKEARASERNLCKENDMDARKLVVGALCAFGLMSAATIGAQTGTAGSPSGTTLVPKTQNNIAYVTGGVGKDEQELADTLKRDGYNMHLVFAEQQTGAYLSDVRVRISDAKGSVVLDTVTDGPMFVAKLPPGRYQVAAEVRGQTKTALIDTAAGGRKVTLLWPSTVDKQGFDTTGSPVSAT
jgi:hypothetical protein